MPASFWVCRLVSGELNKNRMYVYSSIYMCVFIYRRRILTSTYLYFLKKESVPQRQVLLRERQILFNVLLIIYRYSIQDYYYIKRKKLLLLTFNKIRWFYLCVRVQFSKCCGCRRRIRSF